MNAKNDGYSRGELAKHTGVKSETIRYYEGRGLLDAPARSAGGHRIYSEDHRRRLIFIRRCRELGFSLNEIKGLFELADSDEKSCEQVRLVSADHLNDIQKKIKDLKKMERTLRNMIMECDANTSPDCPIIETLSS